jgi:hypothetical protein
MDQKTDKIHVTPLGDYWEIEAENGKPLAHEDDKCEAVKTAKNSCAKTALDHNISV